MFCFIGLFSRVCVKGLALQFCGLRFTLQFRKFLCALQVLQTGGWIWKHDVVQGGFLRGPCGGQAAHVAACWCLLGAAGAVLCLIPEFTGGPVPTSRPQHFCNGKRFLPPLSAYLWHRHVGVARLGSFSFIY